ncbi:MAG: yqfC [Bacillales bacterium]|jgi:sporulation protein YqfC|nr:yqfC [Bacillota bacterium]MDF2945662.1 yqfC [Bacillales bacterium]
MKNFQRDVKKWLADQFDLPPDVLLDQPKINIIAPFSFYIENHRGLVSFSENEVRLLIQDGELLIKGNNFLIKSITPTDLMLKGIIEDLKIKN